jgi:hypothetical protein
MAGGIVKDLSISGKRQVTPILLPLFGPLAQCPGCGTPLDGGPVLYRCQACRRAVPAADVDVEYHAPAGKAAA